MMRKRRSLSVALIGTKFMGRVHSNAWRQAPRVFRLPADVRMAIICGRDPSETRRAARALGWERGSEDWRSVIADPLIDVVDICTPNDSHAEIAIAAAKSGKAIICEKPLSRTLEEARQMRDAVKRAGVTSMVCHNYRRVPAVALAKRIIDHGEVGDRIYHFRARYAQDWLASEGLPMVWRLKSRVAGSGALGDLGSHIIDLAHYLVGEVDSVLAVSETFVKRRPILRDRYADLRADKQSGLRQARRVRPQRTRFGIVDVDDAVSVTGRFRSGALLSLEATRFAPGRKNQLTFEINGSMGSIAFDLEDMNRLRMYEGTGRAGGDGFRDIIATEPYHPYIKGWWPPGHIIGYEHSFVHTILDFVGGIVTRKRVRPDFADGLAVQRVLDAISNSAKTGRAARVLLHEI